MMTRRMSLAVFDPPTDDDPPEEAASVFDKLFPHPTGRNGFEEIIRAGELVRSVENGYFRVRGDSLAQKREYLALPESRDAATLLRRGLAKPITIPDQDPFGADLFLPFALLRALARLLATEIYVRFADGRTDVAVRTVSEGLALSYPLKSVSVLSGLVARAMDAIVLAPAVRNREGWSVRDGNYLLHLAEQWLAVPDPATAALAAERATAFLMLERWRKNPEALGNALEEAYPPSEEGEPESVTLRKGRDYVERLRRDASLRERVFREMADAISGHFDRANALIRDPTRPMVLAPSPSADQGVHPVTVFLRESFLMEARGTVERSVEGRVSLHLLALHAAIRGFRWEQDRLPKTLEELRLPANLVTDPFTATPFVYEPDPAGTGYDLASGGPLYPGEKGKPSARERVTLPWTRPKLVEP